MAIKGHEGSITLAGGVVGNAKAWSLSVAQDTVDTTTFASSGWKESAATLSSWSGTATVVIDTAGTAEGEIITAVTTQASLTVALQVGSVGLDSYDNYSGSANITDYSITNDVNGIVEASISFEGTGALTIA